MAQEFKSLLAVSWKCFSHDDVLNFSAEQTAPKIVSRLGELLFPIVSDVNDTLEN